MGKGHYMPHIQDPDCPCDPVVEEMTGEEGQTVLTIIHRNYHEGEEPVEPLVHMVRVDT